MAIVEEVLKTIRSLAPEAYEFKAEYDNIGLLLGSPNAEVTKVLCCLDLTSAVLDEAIDLGAELIICHHPVIWVPLKKISTESVTGNLLLRAAQNGINIYAAHTNLDFCKDGINEFVAHLLGLRNIEPLDPYINNEAGFGRVGDLMNKVFCTVLKGEVETVLKDNYVRIVGEPFNMVKRIAVINGGGGGDTKYVDMAEEKGADCLITADVRHHVAVYAREKGITLIEPQHFCMEHVYITRLMQILKIEAKAKKINVEILQSTRETNPRF